MPGMDTTGQVACWSMVSGGEGPRGRVFRADIEGLRAVAVIGVVLYHADPRALPGGFAGVDVFFVVSGYLITGLLWAEAGRSGRISMAAFYGRRARRLLPAAMVVVATTALASRLLLPPLRLGSVLRDGLASALYAGNYRFAVEQTDYLNASAPPSPFQHFWSLGVEEQFYLLWPVLLMGTVVLARRLTASRRSSRATGAGSGATTAGWGIPFAILAALSLASFSACVWLTTADQPWAFFSLPTRAWELGAGGMLALAAPAVRRTAQPGAAGIGWAGLGVVVASLFVIRPGTPFPGSVAFAPVIGTVAVLAAGEASAACPASPSALLGLAPVRYVGRISYSWYLWHWPLLVLAPYAAGHPLTVGQALAVAGASGVAASISYWLVESPARRWVWLASLPRRSLLSGVSLSAAGAAVCVFAAYTTPSLAGHGSVTHAVALSAGPVDPAAPAETEAAALTRQVQSEIAASISIEQAPSNLEPSVWGARLDEPDVMVDGCMDSYADDDVEPCSFGDTASPTKVVLFGDSHAAMWFPAVHYAAEARGWNVLNWTKATCPPILLPIFSPDLDRNFTECGIWRQTVLERVKQVHPALVILAMARHYTNIYGFTPYDQPWLQGLTQMIDAIEATGAKVVVIGPVPKPPASVPDCLSQHLDDVTSCTETLSRGINQLGKAAEEVTVRSTGASYLDVQPWFCTSQRCAVVAGNIEMWRDDNHITYTWSNYLGPAMSASLEEVLAGR